MLLIGGNEGEREALLAEARRLIEVRIGKIEAASRVRETAPWGDFGEEHPQWFLNQALAVATRLSAPEVLHEALAIEAQLGRKRRGEGHYSSRTMDIDLIFFNEMVADEAQLTVPHPRMHLRRFVLEPVAELWPEFKHPVLGLSMRQLLEALPAEKK